MVVSSNTITKMQNLPSEKYEILLDIIDQLSCSPIDIFDSMRSEAQAKGIITEENADDFVSGIRKERNAARS